MSARAPFIRFWARLGPRFLPFADAATPDLPLPRLLRLSLFQVSVGMAAALLVGTLNRVMIVELEVAAWLVAAMVGLPVLFAPLRALVGFRSDHHRSALGWKRVPYLWFGTLLQFGGLSIMPFALLVLSGTGHGPAWIGQIGAALAFLAAGAGMQVTQTAGLALATDLAPPAARPRVVALMFVMLLLGMVGGGALFSVLLDDFSPLRLIQVVQGAAVATMALNLAALWKQEARNPAATSLAQPRPAFADAWRAFVARAGARRFLLVVALGTSAFNMQDVVLEPYGAEILRLPVAATSLLTALAAAGALAAFAVAARRLTRGADPYRLVAAGALVGIGGFSAVLLAAPFDAPWLFRAGTAAIGFGSGLFSVGTLTAAMGLDEQAGHGLALGAWGAVQATAAGVAIAAGGALRDLIAWLGAHGAFGPALQGPIAGYSAVYHLELLLLFATLAAVGPLVRATRRPTPREFGLAQFPG
ncbi:MAG: BCD family MFS transporter [Burkholderiaceae bacterium]|nr:BCD family MFS transporter [Burkholderiaceae bacterium]MCX8004461.1 BCD family MFS transporter [Burkholderiaceae bacterium]